MKSKAKNIDEYIAIFPEDIQKLLQQMRQIIRKAAPEAEEVISYSIPAFKLNSVLVYFAGYKNHIGFYPTSSGIRNFQKELSVYKTSKGAVQFPLNKALPVSIITKIVKSRVKEDADWKKQKASNIKHELFSLLSAPAGRALKNNGITTIKQLSKFSQKEILSLHGIGASSIPILQKALKTKGLGFKK